MERYIQFSFYGEGPFFSAGDLRAEVLENRLRIYLGEELIFDVDAEKKEIGIEWSGSEIRLYREDTFWETVSLVGKPPLLYKKPHIVGGIKELMVGRGKFPYEQEKEG